MIRRSFHLLLSCLFLVLCIMQVSVARVNVLNGAVSKPSAKKMVSTNKNYLRSVIVETLWSNPDIVGHLKTLFAAEHATRAAQGNYLPKLDLQGTYGKEKLSNINTNFSYRHLNTIGGKLTLVQNIFSGFYNSSEVSRNKYRTLAQRYLLEGAANEIALLTSKAYLDLLRTSSIIKMAKDNHAAHMRTYRMIKQRSSTGLGRKADTTQARGRLALAKANLLAAENNYQNAVATFKRVTGLYKCAKELKLPVSPARSLLPKNADIACEKALLNHPVLKSANADIKEARAQHSSSKAPNYPRLDLIGEATHGHDMHGLKDRYNDYALYLQLKYNLFAGGSDLAKQKETSALVGKAQAIRDRTYRQVIENMQLAWNSYETTKTQLKYFQDHEAASKTTVGAYREQFKLGKRTLLDLLDSEDELFNARVDNINGKISLLLAKFRILSAEGKLLSYFGIDSFKVNNS